LQFGKCRLDSLEVFQHGADQIADAREALRSVADVELRWLKSRFYFVP
jgi:hypothetical protein